MMASFYEKMVKVFGVGQNYLFHAAAYGKLYSLHAARAAVSGDKAEDAELEKLSSLVLLSALAVPIGSGLLGEGGKRREAGEEGEAKGKLGRLAALLGLAAAPTRAGLITDAVRSLFLASHSKTVLMPSLQLNRHVLKRVSPELRALYTILEVDFHPLSITSKIEPILAALAEKPETARYVEPLKDVVLARLFQQLAQVYASLKVDRVVKLASFVSDGEKEVTRKRVERFVTEACRRGDLDVTIDHATGSIKFDEDLFGSDAAPVASASSQYDSVKTLQPSATTLLRTHLTRLAATLYTTLEVVSPHNSPIASALASRALAFAALEAQVGDERDTLVARTQIIKRRKELADEQLARKEKEEAHERTVRAQVKAEEDAKKQKEDLIRRERDKIRRELDALKKAENLKTIQAIEASQPGFKIDRKVSRRRLSLFDAVLLTRFASSQDAEELDSAALVKIRIDQLETEKKSLAQKLTGVSKRIDHLERAFRREEIPLLTQDYQRQQKRDRETHESSQHRRVDTLRKQHADDLAIKARLVNIMPDYAAFRERTEAESKKAFEREAENLREQLEEAKAERRAEVKEQIAREKEQRAEREAQEAHDREQRAGAFGSRCRRPGGVLTFSFRPAEQARLNAEAEEAEEAEKAAIEERKRKLDDEAAAITAARLATREAERAADREKIALQLAREEEALARRQNRPPPSSNGPAPVGSAAWRAAQAAPSSAGERPKFALAPRTAPIPAAAPPPARVEPTRAAAEAPRPAGPPVVVAGGAKPTWREKEAARLAAEASGAAPPRAAAAPAPPAGPARVGSGTWSARRGEGEFCSSLRDRLLELVLTVALFSFLQRLPPRVRRVERGVVLLPQRVREERTGLLERSDRGNGRCRSFAGWE